MDEIIKIVESLEKSGLLTDGGSKTVKDGIKKTRKWTVSFYDGTYSCFIDSTNGFFINTPYSLFFNKLYNWRKTKRSVSSIVSTTFNDESIRKRS